MKFSFWVPRVTLKRAFAVKLQVGNGKLYPINLEDEISFLKLLPFQGDIGNF